MRVFVLTSDRYLAALRPFAHLFCKYWSPEQPVVVGGFTPPSFRLPDNFSFYSIGSFEEYPVNRWSDAARAFVEAMGDEAFVLMLEDYWLTRQVDTRAVRILYDYALQFRYVAKIDLCGDRLYAHGADLNYGTVGHLDLVKSMPGSPYHFSLMTGIWRAEHLVRHLQPGWTPWDCEIIGTTHLSHDQDVIVLGTRQWPARHTLAFRAGEPGTLDVSEVNPADVAEMREMGLLAPWGIE